MQVDTGKGASKGGAGSKGLPVTPEHAWWNALVAARLEVLAVYKAGQAPQAAGGYDFVTRDDIVQQGAPLLAKHGLALIPVWGMWRQCTERSISRRVVFKLGGHGHVERLVDSLPVLIHRDPIKETAAADTYIEKYQYLRVLGIPRSDYQLDPDAYEQQQQKKVNE